MDMGMDDGGLRYSDHFYYDLTSSDEEDSEDELFTGFDETADVDAPTHEANESKCSKPDNARLGIAVEARRSLSRVSCEDTVPEVAGKEPLKCSGMSQSKEQETLTHEFTMQMEAGQLNGKNFEDLTFDDMKEVYFPSVDEAEKFYKLYSRIVGFSVRRGRQEKEGDKLVLRRQWLCSKEGEAKVRRLAQKGSPKIKCEIKQQMNSEAKKCRRNMVGRGRRYTRVNCQAEFNVRYCRDRHLYFVTKFIYEHNHDLALPNETQFLRSNRKVEEGALGQVENLLHAHVHTSAAYEHLVEQSGGRDFVGFTIKDLYNTLDRKRKYEQMDGDAQAALTWMNMKKIESADFYSNYTKDEEGRLANLFWRDTQSLLDYTAYGDVLIMDSTYKTNLYGKPLAVFVGCNNHRATVVFGFALIQDEKEETYEWVFDNFLKSMKNKKPQTVLTDGDEAIRKVVTRLMPSARHRLCAWHIGRNIGQNVKDEAAQKAIGEMIHCSMSTAEWVAAWRAMVSRHELRDNAWVSSLFDRREKWAEAFFRGWFCGGMCSTQRVEGTHSKLKKEVGRHTRVKDVMPRMERTVGRMRNRVLYDNFMSKNSAPIYETHMRGIEQDACRVFTHDIFVMIKCQILFERRFVKDSEVVFNVSDSTVYYLRQYDKPERKWAVEFQADATDPKWLCSCKLFESDGIPCGHIFHVLKLQGVTKYPKSLINRRWTKEISEETMAPTLKVRGSDKSLRVARYSAMTSAVSKACLNYSFSEEGFKVGMTEIAKLVQNSMEFAKDGQADTKTQPEISDIVKDPTKSRIKGMPPNPSTNKESATTGLRACRKCLRTGHNSRTCGKHNIHAPDPVKKPSTTSFTDAPGSVHHTPQSVNLSTTFVPSFRATPFVTSHHVGCKPMDHTFEKSVWSCGQDFTSFTNLFGSQESHEPMDHTFERGVWSHRQDFTSFPSSQQSLHAYSFPISTRRQSSLLGTPPSILNLNMTPTDDWDWHESFPPTYLLDRGIVSKTEELPGSIEMHSSFLRSK